MRKSARKVWFVCVARLAHAVHLRVVLGPTTASPSALVMWFEAPWSAAAEASPGPPEDVPSGSEDRPSLFGSSSGGRGYAGRGERRLRFFSQALAFDGSTCSVFAV